MANSMASDARTFTTWSIVLSILMLAIGVLAIAVPVIAGVAATVTVGWLLVLSGALHLVFAWRAGSAGAVLWEVLLGVLYAAIGVYMLINPLLGLASLTFAIAFYLLLEGVLELALSFRLRPARGSGWLLVDAIVTLALAVMIWSTWPSSAAWVIGTLIGISMLFSGITRLMLSVAVRRAVA
jgi:uncharacterized membrane protein HdeD (DUF308 family)